MAGQNHVRNGLLNRKGLAGDGARVFGLGLLVFMILSCHDSVNRCWVERMARRGWGTDRIMAGQNHVRNGLLNRKGLAGDGARVFGLGLLVFMILSCHDSVNRCWVERMARRGWGTDRIMAGQNHAGNGVARCRMLAGDGACVWVKFIGLHDSVPP